MSSPATLYETIRTEAGKVVVGNEDILEGLTISLLTGGHVLLEGFLVSPRRRSQTHLRRRLG